MLCTEILVSIGKGWFRFSKHVFDYTPDFIHHPIPQRFYLSFSETLKTRTPSGGPSSPLGDGEQTTNSDLSVGWRI